MICVPETRVVQMATAKREVDVRLRSREAELQIGRGKRRKSDSAKVRDNIEQRDKRARLSLPSTTSVLAIASNERNCMPVHKQVLKPTSRKSDRH